MVILGWKASPEQYTPGEMLEFAMAAENAKTMPKHIELSVAYSDESKWPSSR